MKLLTKLSLITTALAVLGTSGAFADDQQLQNRLALQQAQNPHAGDRTTTVALYANQRGAGRDAVQDQRSEFRFEVRSNPHGQTDGAYVAE